MLWQRILGWGRQVATLLAGGQLKDSAPRDGATLDDGSAPSTTATAAHLSIAEVPQSTAASALPECLRVFPDGEVPSHVWEPQSFAGRPLFAAGTSRPSGQRRIEFEALHWAIEVAPTDEAPPAALDGCRRKRAGESVVDVYLGLLAVRTFAAGQRDGTIACGKLDFLRLIGWAAPDARLAEKQKRDGRHRAFPVQSRLAAHASPATVRRRPPRAGGRQTDDLLACLRYLATTRYWRTDGTVAGGIRVLDGFDVVEGRQGPGDVELRVSFSPEFLGLLDEGSRPASLRFEVYRELRPLLARGLYRVLAVGERSRRIPLAVLLQHLGRKGRSSARCRVAALLEKAHGALRSARFEVLEANPTWGGKGSAAWVEYVLDVRHTDRPADRLLASHAMRLGVAPPVAWNLVEGPQRRALEEALGAVTLGMATATKVPAFIATAARKGYKFLDHGTRYLPGPGQFKRDFDGVGTAYLLEAAKERAACVSPADRSRYEEVARDVFAASLDGEREGWLLEAFCEILIADRYQTISLPAYLRQHRQPRGQPAGVISDPTPF